MVGLAGGYGLTDELEDLARAAEVFAAVPAVGEVELDGLPAGGGRGGEVADGAFEVVEDGVGLPGLGGVAEGLVALDRALQLRTGFVVLIEGDELNGDVAARLAFVLKPDDNVPLSAE